MAKPNLLNSIKLSRPKKSVFDLSHDVKLSCNMGDLVPVLCTEVLPSDNFQLSQESLVRLQPMVAPMMHRCDISFHNFFVPCRLLWPNFEKWITNQKVAGALPAFPYISFSNSDPYNHTLPGDLANFLGIPPTDEGESGVIEQVNAMPFAAYQMIYNEYYRDQNLIDEVPFELIDGSNDINSPELLVLRKRAWEHDYFTACAPTAQAGAAVDLPLGDVALKTELGAPGLMKAADDHLFTSGDLSADTLTGVLRTSDLNEPAVYDPNGTLETEPTTINDLRTAFRLQEWLEKSMRGGRRLFENILIFFGLRSPDSRLQRPEYIGGNKTPIMVSEVLNNTSIDGEAPQGNMAGHGVAVVNPKNSSYRVQEWGYIVTIMSVMPKTAYQQGLHRMWNKIHDPMEWYWPQFDHLGEQEVVNREIVAYSAVNNQTFGYIPRYAEYKFMNSRTVGDFQRSLDFWTMTRVFDSPPGLNQSFIECTPSRLPFAVTDEDIPILLVHVYHKIRAIRPMSKFSTPSF